MSAVDKEVNYSVVFMGEIIIGFEKPQVLKNLVSITRLSSEEVEQRFFNKSAGRVVIKRTSNLEKARQYHGKFSRAGIAVGIQMDFEEVE